MELSCITSSCSPSLLSGGGISAKRGDKKWIRTLRVRSAAERIDDGSVSSRGRGVITGAGPAMEISSPPSSSSANVGQEAEFPVWDKLGAVVRLSYGIGIYGAMAIAGRWICSVAGIDETGGFHPSLEAVIDGLGYASPPVMALLFILDDEVVKYSPHARAIRDVEDEELRSFFYGMSPWQFMLIVLASSIGEELFYRVAVQGGLSDIFMRSTEILKDARGIASLTGVLPPLVPFAQAFAAAITAALTGSLYYVAAGPKDPTYVVAPVLQSRCGQNDLKKLFAAWYERRQMKKIYSPLLEGLLALYLGFEWIQTGNILAPMITHGIYSTVVLGNGLWKIHYHQQRLRHRIQQIRVEGGNSHKL
ncbi:uncharacterized protein LOC110034011 [Phalaenopsis equestris]|uniref:uncharacterized protein LOC110034011 n=1 Tax=Phalaenopsis equestris TaxID=78828 RepID=UPI0009E59188|nr:uncharacterized protein LOC110034011 [Phalaenopsis equestris]